MELVALIVIPILILFNAFFVAIEFALVAVRKTRVEALVQQKVSGAQAVAAAQHEMENSIAAAQLGITVASIALGAVSEKLLAHYLEPILIFLPISWHQITRHGLATLLAIFFITIIHVILGEQIPKLIAIQRTESTALLFARPLRLFTRLSYPILRVMNAMSRFLIKQLGIKIVREAEVLSIEELRLVIEDSQEAGLLNSDQAIFLQNVFKLTNKMVEECMIPVDKMDALELHTPPDQVLEVVRECGHTRLPVYDGDINQIVGIVNTKNLFYFFSLANVVVLEDALYPPTYLDPKESIANALRLFQKTKRPMAIVRSDKKIVGLITLEDVLEEIVGDLEDEHDDPRPQSTTKTIRIIRSKRSGKKDRHKQ